MWWDIILNGRPLADFSLMDFSMTFLALFINDCRIWELINRFGGAEWRLRLGNFDNDIIARPHLSLQDWFLVMLGSYLQLFNKVYLANLLQYLLTHLQTIFMRAQHCHIVNDLTHEFTTFMINLHDLFKLLNLLGRKTGITVTVLHKLID